VPTLPTCSLSYRSPARSEDRILGQGRTVSCRAAGTGTDRRVFQSRHHRARTPCRVEGSSRRLLRREPDHHHAPRQVPAESVQRLPRHRPRGRVHRAWQQRPYRTRPPPPPDAYSASSAVPRLPTTAYRWTAASSWSFINSSPEHADLTRCGNDPAQVVGPSARGTNRLRNIVAHSRVATPKRPSSASPGRSAAERFSNSSVKATSTVRWASASVKAEAETRSDSSGRASMAGNPFRR